MYPQEDLAVLRRIIALQDRTTIPDSEQAYSESRERRADGAEVVLCLGSPTQETAREWRAAWSEEVAGINLDIHRIAWTPTRTQVSTRLRQTRKAELTAADRSKRRELLLRLRNLGGLVEYATIAPRGRWYGSLEAVARQLHITTEQLIAMGFLLRATPKGRRIASSRTSGAAPPNAALTFTIASVLEMAGISSTTLNSYAKMAGVKTPHRGKRNHLYTFDEVCAILEKIVDRTTDRDLRGRCRVAIDRCLKGAMRK